MPDKEAPQSLIINTLAAGEISPSLYGRTDLAKFHQSAALMRNFMVDYRGGAVTRPGTQFVGSPVGSGYARLIPFIFSGSLGQSYMLVLTNQLMEFIKNPGTTAYPNSSNAGFILNAGVHYSIATPWLSADLPYLKFSQVADKLTITRRGYPRQVLSRLSDTNWTLAPVSTSFPVTPAQPSIACTGLPAGSPDPQTTTYAYCITSVDTFGNESFASPIGFLAGQIDIAVTQGTMLITWGAISGTAYYKVYKFLPTPGRFIPSVSASAGFIGYANGPTFTDPNILPDFTNTPPLSSDPFSNGAITGYAISASSADWPVNGTSISIADATGSGALIVPILSTNTVGAVGSIIGLYIQRGGADYTAPTITAVGGGTTFTGTVSISPTSGNDPDVCGLFQQRQIYASSNNFPNTIWGSRPGSFADFRKNNPVVDNDTFTFSIAAQQVVSVVWLRSMPGGLVVGTNSGIVQLTGGSSSAANPAAVTPANGVIVPQSNYGCADLHPIIIDYNILHVQAEGSLVRELQYSFYLNIYSGTDITSLSSHLFYPKTVIDWDYQDIPFKTIWAVRSDGNLLSLAYLKSQEILGWAQHSSQGSFESVAAVREGISDAVYFSVVRNGVRSIERLCDRIYGQVDDAWCLDAAVSTTVTFPNAAISSSAATGAATITASAAVFSAPNVGSVIRAGSLKAVITGYTDTQHVTAALAAAPYGAWPQGPAPFNQIGAGSWRMDPVVTTVSGLSYLNGLQVYALVDGIPQGPFTVSGGTITLNPGGSAVVVGLPFTAQLQTLFLDIGGELTIQGKRKKITAASFRVKDTAGLQYGTQFDTLQVWNAGTSSTDPAQYWPGIAVAGLFFGDQRLALDPSFDVTGSLCIVQNKPLPASILAIIAEVAQGDTT